MTKRSFLAASALIAASVFVLTGCGQQAPDAGTDPTKDPGTIATDPGPIITADPNEDSSTDSEFEKLLPKNSTSQTTVARGEGELKPGEAIDLATKDQAESAWKAQFACSSDKSGRAEALVNDEVVDSVMIDCADGAGDIYLKFSGSGTITMRITGDGDGIYVMQLSKDPAV